jgi:hypothetical protein
MHEAKRDMSWGFIEKGITGFLSSEDEAMKQWQDDITTERFNNKSDVIAVREQILDKQRYLATETDAATQSMLRDDLAKLGQQRQILRISPSRAH